MPLYEYECDACGHRFEHIHQKFSEPPIDICPKCGGHVHKLMSSPAIQFKGSGFYITDYPKKDPPHPGKPDATGAGHESKSPGAGESKGETKSDAKGDAKADAKPSSSSASDSTSGQTTSAKPSAAPTKSE